MCNPHPSVTAVLSLLSYLSGGPSDEDYLLKVVQRNQKVSALVHKLDVQ